MEVNISELESISRSIRGKLVDISYRTHSAHLGSALSCTDILVAAYWGALNIDPQSPKDPNRDRFILSKGHAVTSLYTALAYRGFFSFDVLDTYAQSGTNLAEHPILNSAPGIEATTGSLGHGLSLGLGMAIAGNIIGHNHRVFTLLGDGECNEGTVWEAALFAPAKQLDRVAVIIDYNKWQATGRSNEVMSLDPLRKKWESFGWSSYEIDGHDMKALVEVLQKVPDDSGRPVAIIAHTIKGKGISFMEDDNNWHYRIPTEEEVEKAKAELGLL